MNNLTRGGLQPAKITNLQSNEVVYCMFNPFEYTITKTNSWTRQPRSGQNAPRVTFTQGSPRSLTLNLYFDGYASKTDVTTYTKPLWKMMMVDEQLRESQTNKSVPPDVAFEWGQGLYFKAIITNMSEAFSLFLEDGTPVRCKVTIGLQERLPDEEVAAQTEGGDSAGSPSPTTTTSGNDRPDNVAGPDNMRSTMSANNVDNPLNVPNGTPMVGA